MHKAALLLLLLVQLAAAAPVRIAIVGGGIGGTSAAYFLRQLQPTWHIELFERERIGGRWAASAAQLMSFSWYYEACSTWTAACCSIMIQQWSSSRYEGPQQLLCFCQQQQQQMISRSCSIVQLSIRVSEMNRCDLCPAMVFDQATKIAASH
jgi:hypothetical protein